MSAKLMGEIAKFFSGGKSGPKALLLAYARFGKEAVNKYFKERQPSYNMKIDNKNIGGMAESDNTVNKKLKAENKKRARLERKRKLNEKIAKMKGVNVPINPKKNAPISDVDNKPRPKPSPFKPTKFRNGGMVRRRAGAAKRGFNNFKGIF